MSFTESLALVAKILKEEISTLSLEDKILLRENKEPFDLTALFWKLQKI